ncbi:MAG: transporter substrate-binding domain-containing protein [Bacteroidia bacterium]|nr:transporter substrate-binding domain-containing protein [Bacteroidia bacterium]
MNNIRLVILIFLGLWMHPLCSGTDTLQIGIIKDPPFIFEDASGSYDGISVHLWEQIADRLNLQFEYALYSDKLGILRALDYNEIDLSIDPMFVNPTRLKLFDVSQPFFISSIGVATTSKDKSQLQVFLSNFFSLDFFRLILLLVFIIFVFGFILWLFERRHNKRQFRPGLIGLFDGLWWSAVTMTTVGYGDKAPKTKAGRIIAMIWMFTAIVLISGFTATIASTLTIRALGSDIQHVDDLRRDQNLGTVYASSAYDFLNKHDIAIGISYDSPEEAIRGLLNKETNVLVYDKTVLDYIINTNQLNEDINLLPVNFNKQYQSIFMPKENDLMDKVNPEILSIISDIQWHEVLKEYDVRVE